MGVIWQIIVVNVYSLTVPFLIFLDYYFNISGIMIRDHNKIMAIIIYGTIIITPYIVFISYFLKHGKENNYSSVVIFRRIATAFVVWSIGLWLESGFRKIFFREIKLPFMPVIEWHDPMYQITLSGLELLYCMFVLTLAVILSYFACRSITESR